MIRSSTTEFHKQASCPATETLLAYQRGAALAADARARIRAHIRSCDFCGAEFQLLINHPPQQETEHTTAHMPLNLRCLAEALLAKSTKALAAASFAEALQHKASLTLTDA